MATREEVAMLLAVPCDWCGASRGVRCYPPVDKTRSKRNRRRITSIDGGVHNARWQTVFGRDGKVVADALPAGRFRRQPATIERPW